MHVHIAACACPCVLTRPSSRMPSCCLMLHAPSSSPPASSHCPSCHCNITHQFKFQTDSWFMCVDFGSAQARSMTQQDWVQRPARPAPRTLSHSRAPPITASVITRPDLDTPARAPTSELACGAAFEPWSPHRDFSGCTTAQILVSMRNIMS